MAPLEMFWKPGQASVPKMVFFFFGWAHFGIFVFWMGPFFRGAPLEKGVQKGDPNLVKRLHSVVFFTMLDIKTILDLS